MLKGCLNICIKSYVLSNKSLEKKLLEIIALKTFSCNKDNISRTNAYFHFYNLHRDIRWSLLAHMVSRNAGWNMCDLEGHWVPRILNQEKRQWLFHTYERANWLIFQDAYPQLLLYHYSTKIGKPMFHLLKYFHVSLFMEAEWNYYWKARDDNRLMTSLIINEQNVIQQPVIENPDYARKVFKTVLFFLQDWLHFSYVLFPTMEGELYGASVNGFWSVSKRIDLGKRLANILFHDELHQGFIKFVKNTPHTGSRYDYEQLFFPKLERTTPFLRSSYPVVEHDRDYLHDWSLSKRLKRGWFSKNIHHRHSIHLTEWYKDKQKQLHAVIILKQLFGK